MEAVGEYSEPAPLRSTASEMPVTEVEPTTQVSVSEKKHYNRRKLSEGLARAGEGAALPQKKYFRSRAHINPLNRLSDECDWWVTRSASAIFYATSGELARIHTSSGTFAAPMILMHTIGQNTSRHLLIPPIQRCIAFCREQFVNVTLITLSSSIVICECHYRFAGAKLWM